MGAIKEFINFVRDIFIPVKESDSNTQYIQEMILRILISLLFISGILVIFLGVLYQVALIRASLLGLFFLLVGFLSQWLYKHKQLKLSRRLIVLALFASVSLYAYTGGGLESPVFPSIYVILIISGLLLSNRTFLYAFFFTVCLTVFITVITINGYLPAPSVVHVPFSRMLVHLFLLFMTLVLIYLFTNVVRKSLAKAREESIRRTGAETDTNILFNSIDLAVAVTSLEGRILGVNEQFKTLFNSHQTIRDNPDHIFPLIGEKNKNLLTGMSSEKKLEFRYNNPELNLATDIEIRVKHIHFRNEDSLLFSFIDITDKKKAFDDQEALLDRSRRQRSALIKIALSPALSTGDIKFGIREITENAAHAIRADRVSIWIGSPKKGKITCLDLYKSSKQEHGNGHTLEAEHYPRYFQALTLSRVIDANLAQEDLRTREFTDNYLKPNGITSMLDATIRVSGQIEGVVCIEHVGEPRVWLPDEIRFAGEIADHIAQAFLLEERKKAETALIRSEERYRVLVEQLPESAIVMYDEDLRFILVDGPEVSVAGFNKAEMVGKTLFEIFPEEYASVFEPNMRRVFMGESFNRTLPFGDLFYNYHYVPLKDETGKISMGLLLARNVTEKKRAEEELLQSEERYRSFFEEDLSGDFIASPDGKITDCNPSFMRIFGFGAVDEAQSTNIVTLFRVTSVWKSILNQLNKNEDLEYFEIEMVRIDGQPVYIIGNFIGKKDDNGKLRIVKGYLFDDTRRRELENQLFQSQKMQSIGTLAGGIAHDFNNLLGIIIGRTQMLELKVADDQRLVKEANIIRQAAERGTGLVRQLLTFARKNEFKLERLKINHLVEEMERLIRETFPKTISIEKKLKPDIPEIQADSTQLHQVLLNLCVNSRDAMPNGGMIRISTDLIEGDLLQQKYKNAVARSYIHITVQDSGAGIEPAILNRIYEPFFTTKDIGKGTGLGLSVVYGIVSSHNGFISVESLKGKGTTFQIFLPVDELILDTTGAEPQEFALTPGGQETLLLIEDEQMLRDLVFETLSAKGYTVIPAQNGIEGIEIYQAQSGAIDMVISDYGLPVMNGSQVFAYLSQIKPDVKFILASGFIDPSLKGDLSKQGIHQFIEKPYRPEELAMRIRMVLDGK
ncbi:MAG: PAS domain S-box protein [Bacteroidetes bacterium]|nr:PAS domain S-box protein [Bacteroidota bacterium]